MENQPVEIVGHIGQRQFGLRPRQPDRPDEQAVAVLLVCEDMLGGGSNRRLLCIGLCGGRGHRLARRLAPMNAARQHVPCKPGLVLLRTIGAIGPDIRRRVVPVDDMLQLPAIGCGRRRDRAGPDEAETPVD